MRVTVHCLPSDLGDRLKAVTCLSLLCRSQFVCVCTSVKTKRSTCEKTIEVHLRRISKQKRIEIKIV